MLHEKINIYLQESISISMDCQFLNWRMVPNKYYLSTNMI